MIVKNMPVLRNAYTADLAPLITGEALYAYVGSDTTHYSDSRGISVPFKKEL